jgi:hypothetical protein
MRGVHATRSFAGMVGGTAGPTIRTDVGWPRATAPYEWRRN